MENQTLPVAEPIEAELAGIDRMVAELHTRGYVDLDEHTYPRTGKVLQVGARVRHCGEQYWQAYQRGTGNVVALLHKPNSSWSRSYGTADVELIMLRDTESVAGSRLPQVAQYHVGPITVEG